MVSTMASTTAGSYVASEMLQVTTPVRSAGAVLDAAITAGANTSYGLTYQSSNADALYRTALAKAVQSARSTAEAIASAAHLTIVRVASISNTQEQMGPQPMMRVDGLGRGSDPGRDRYGHGDGLCRLFSEVKSGLLGPLENDGAIFQSPPIDVKLFQDDCECPAARCFLAHEIAVGGPVKILEACSECVGHCLEYEYALHDPREPFTHRTTQGRQTLLRTVPSGASHRILMIVHTFEGARLTDAKVGSGMPMKAPRLCTATVVNREFRAPGFWYVRLRCEHVARNAGPAQYVALDLPGGFAVRLPLGIYTASDDEFGLLFQEWGERTSCLAALPEGEEISCLGPLGSEFTLPKRGSKATIVAGGLGVAAFWMLSRDLQAAAIDTTIVLGAGSKDHVVGREELAAFGFPIEVCTDDGSFGFHGNVVERLRASATRYALWLWAARHAPRAMRAC